MTTLAGWVNSYCQAKLIRHPAKIVLDSSTELWYNIGMVLVTFKEITELRDAKGAPLTWHKFNYYLKRGLLFAPDIKRKRKLNEGTVSYFAEEILDRLRKVFQLQEKGYSLEEIKGLLHEG